MNHHIENRYRYGLVYNLDGQIVGFNISPDVFVGLTDDDIEKALEAYAKRKLEQESESCEERKNCQLKKEPCEDAISRSELLKAIDTYDKFGYLDHDLIPLVSKDGIKLVPYIHYDDVVKCIKDTPSIQPEQSTGHWLDTHTYDKNKQPIYECSKCHREVADYYIKCHKFCLHCGAKMEEGE